MNIVVASLLLYGAVAILARVAWQRHDGSFHRALQLALLCEHAQWMLDNERDPRGRAAALRYARLPVDLLHETDPGLDRDLLS